MQSAGDASPQGGLICDNVVDLLGCPQDLEAQVNFANAKALLAIRMLLRISGSSLIF